LNFSFFGEYYSYFITGTINTILLAFFTVLLGVLIGIVLALMKTSKNKLLRFIASTYIEIIRGTPLLVQISIIFYGLPISFPDVSILGMDIARFVPGIIALSINSGAYVAEIIRAGIQAIDKGQMEASRSLGLTHTMSMRYIILPQAIRNILPALGNEFVVVIKESSIVSVIGIAELMYSANIVRGATYRPIEPLLIAAAIYFVLTFTLSKFIGKAERRMRAGD
jgi:arginine/lysine/histidine transport system permease protein